MITQTNSQGAGLTRRSAGSLASLNVNIDSMLCDLNSAFNPLHRDCLLNYQVRAINTGQVCMSVVMPNEMLQSFSVLLECLGGFFRVVNGKARSSSATIKARDLDEIAERQQRVEVFNTEVCALFDGFIKEGLTNAEAIKRVNLALKARNDPWTSHYVITSVLRAKGRLRKPKSKKGVIQVD